MSATVARERTPEVLNVERTRVGRVTAMDRMAMEQVINAALLKADMFACMLFVVFCLLCLLLVVLTTDNLVCCSYERLSRDRVDYLSDV